MYSGTMIARSEAHLDFVLKKYAKSTGFNYEDIKGKSRKRNLVMIRKIFSFNMRKQGFGLKEIGDAIGGRDHTTIIHNINSYNDLNSISDPLLKLYIKKINN